MNVDTNGFAQRGGLFVPAATADPDVRTELVLDLRSDHHTRKPPMTTALTTLATSDRADLGDNVNGVGTEPVPLADATAGTGASTGTDSGTGTDSTTGTGTDASTGTGTGTGDRSDAELLNALDALYTRTNRRPTRQEVMAETGVGTSRATRLLATLEQRHGWESSTGTKRGTDKPPAARRTGTAKRAQDRRPRPVQPATTPEVDPPGTAAAAVPVPVPTVPVEAVPVPVPVPESAPVPVPVQTALPVPVPETGPQGGRFVSWLGFGFGSIVSIAGNVLHAWLPPEHAPAGWHPGVVPQLGAAVWPVMLLLSVEVLSRVRWRDGFLWRLARYGGTGTVAVGAAIISYGHVSAVLSAWGYGPVPSHVGPLVIDGLMVISGFALLSTTTSSRKEN